MIAVGAFMVTNQWAQKDIFRSEAAKLTWGHQGKGKKREAGQNQIRWVLRFFLGDELDMGVEGAKEKTLWRGTTTRTNENSLDWGKKRG